MNKVQNVQVSDTIGAE